MLDAAGFVIVYAFLAPYLYLFVPRERREVGARLLFWVWAPAIIAGAMTAFTSAAGYLNGAVGFLPALMVSGLFLALGARGRGAAVSVEDVAEPTAESFALQAPVGGACPWLALAVLVRRRRRHARLPVPVPAARSALRASLTKRFDSGPGGASR